MRDVNQKRDGKTHRDENFPVASWLIRSQHRAPILAFYNFVRAADDVADDPALTVEQKLSQLDRLEEDLTGSGSGDPRAIALRRALAERNMDAGHALDLLKAFRLDATKRRYANWDELIAYCALSAMPVGRFVLDLHGESRATWPASDALCAALQIINHLQDCGDDYRTLDRVYLPLDILAKHGADVEELGAPTASPALRASIADLAQRTVSLLSNGEGLAASIADWRLGLEISVIHSLASRLAQMLTIRDPLGEETHIGKLAAGGVAVRAIAKTIAQRLRVDRPQSALGDRR